MESQHAFSEQVEVKERERGGKKEKKKNPKSRQQIKDQCFMISVKNKWEMDIFHYWIRYFLLSNWQRKKHYRFLSYICFVRES